MAASWSDAPLGVLDACRRATLKAFQPASSRLAADRELRIAVLGSVALVFAWACVVAAPLALLAIGPLLFGVPHVLADVRYLVIRPGLHRRRALLLLAVPLAAAATTRLVEGTLVAVLLAVLLARASLGRKLLLFALIAPLGAALWSLGWVAVLVLAHGHNLVALAMAATWRRPRTLLPLLPIALAVVGALAIGLGAIDHVAPFLAPVDGDADAQLARLAPGLPAPWDVRLLLSFAFLQSAHYAVWLRLVPDEDRRQPTPRSFRSSWRALAADVSTPVLVAALLATLFFVAWGLADPMRAGDTYLRLAAFHGPLELAAAALALAERRRPGASA